MTQPAWAVKARGFVHARFTREGATGLYFTIGFLICLALVAAFCMLADEVLELKAHPSSIDLYAGGALASLRSPGLTALMKAVTSLGGAPFLLIAAPLVIAALVWQKHTISALLFGGSVLGGFGLSAGLKIALGRARPDLWPALVKETTYSLPSGHSTMATVFYGGLAAVVFHLTPKRRWRLLALAAAAVVVLGVTTSRVYLGAHWATDTVAGVLLGSFWVVVYTTGTEFITRRRAAVAPKDVKGEDR